MNVFRGLLDVMFGELSSVDWYLTFELGHELGKTRCLVQRFEAKRHRKTDRKAKQETPRPTTEAKVRMIISAERFSAARMMGVPVSFDPEVIGSNRKYISWP